MGGPLSYAKAKIVAKGDREASYRTMTLYLPIELPNES